MKMDLRETGCVTKLAQDRDQWRGSLRAVMNILVPSKAISFTFGHLV